MGSTGGGFLIGFGACLLLVSLVVFSVLAQFYGQIMGLKGVVEQIYYITHSAAYEGAMGAMETLSPYANRIADIISGIPGLSGLAWALRQIGSAASNMRSIYYASETAYRAIRVVEMAPEYLFFGMLLGLVLIVIGAVLVVRARRKSAPPPPPPPPPS